MIATQHISPYLPGISHPLPLRMNLAAVYSRPTGHYDPWMRLQSSFKRNVSTYLWHQFRWLDLYSRFVPDKPWRQNYRKLLKCNQSVKGLLIINKFNLQIQNLIIYAKWLFTLVFGYHQNMCHPQSKQPLQKPLSETNSKGQLIKQAHCPIVYCLAKKTNNNITKIIILWFTILCNKERMAFPLVCDGQKAFPFKSWLCSSCVLAMFWPANASQRGGGLMIWNDTANQFAIYFA